MAYMVVSRTAEPEGTVILEAIWNRRGNTVFADGVRVTNPSSKTYRLSITTVQPPPEPGAESVRFPRFSADFAPGSAGVEVMFPNNHGPSGTERTVTVIDGGNAGISLQEEVVFNAV